jgi:hypothetical protein
MNIHIYDKGLLVLALFTDGLGAFASGTEIMGKKRREVEEEILTDDHEV